MSLLVAYADFRDRTPGLRAGQAFKRAADAGTIPVGPAHAVEEKSDLALCGLRIPQQPARREWPPGMGSRCPDCRALADRTAF